MRSYLDIYERAGRLWLMRNHESHLYVRLLHGILQHQIKWAHIELGLFQSLSIADSGSRCLSNRDKKGRTFPNQSPLGSLNGSRFILTRVGESRHRRLLPRASKVHVSIRKWLRKANHNIYISISSRIPLGDRPFLLSIESLRLRGGMKPASSLSRADIWSTSSDKVTKTH
jgi:hypothetical protein